MRKALSAWILLALACLLFASLVLAMPSVVIEPKTGGNYVTLYPLEVADFVLRVENTGGRGAEENLTLFVSLDPQLALVLDGREVRDQNLFVARLEPNEAKTFDLRVKALPFPSPSGQALVRVNYGFERFTHSASTFVLVEPSPLQLNARLSRSVLNPGEETNLSLDLSNTGKEAVSGIQVELQLPEEFTAERRTYSLEDLNPGQSVSNRAFKLHAGEVVGKRVVVTRVVYADERGRHVLEKSFEVEVEERGRLLAMFVAVIFVFAILSFIFQRKEKRHKVVPSGGHAPGAHPTGHDTTSHGNAHAAPADGHGDAPAGAHASHAPIKPSRKTIRPTEKPFQPKSRR